MVTASKKSDLAETTTWRSQTDPHGFTVKTPAGWTLAAPNGTTAVVAGSADHALVVVRPFLAATGATAGQCLQAAPTSLADVLPGASLGQVVNLPGPPQEAAASMTFQGSGGASAAGVLCAVNGYSGMLYAIGAPASTFGQLRPTLIAVLKSFTFTGKPSAPSASYVTFTDPLEQAFTVEVPQGWPVSGGMHRYAAVDVRPEVDVSSPDGGIRLRYGDQSIGPFEAPNPLLAQAGYSAGTQVSNGYGVTFQIDSYVPGAEFAQQYVQSAWASLCPGLSVVNSTDRPQSAAALNQQVSAFASTGVQAHFDAGDVSFTCANGLRGYEFAATLDTTSESGTIWMIYNLLGYLAPAAQTSQAQQALDHMAATFRQDPGWLQRQGNQAVATAQIASQAGQQIANDIQQGYWYRQSVNDQLRNSWSNTILGQQDEVNPDTGEEYKVASGYNYYWEGPTGQITGTDTGQPPDINVTQLNQLPLNG